MAKLPGVPTTKEAGMPEFQASPWFALFAPKGTPHPFLDTLTDGLDKALDDQNVRKLLLELADDIPGQGKTWPTSTRCPCEE
jgi:tripartite-type tricarboxylate transporter receptor subunit TctC